ncbi:MAG: DUF4838 domain-containing protein [Planctomycetota bacterium]
MVKNYSIGLLTFCLIIIISNTPAGAEELKTIPWQSRPSVSPDIQLKHYLSRLAEKPPRIIASTRETANKTENGVIFLGEAAQSAFTPDELNSMPFDSFRLRVKNGNVYLAGKPARGLEYGTYFLLEQLGVKFLGPSYEFIPPMRDKLTFPSWNFFEKPFFEMREITGNYNRQGQHTIVYDVGYPSAADPELSKKIGGIMIDHTAQFLCPVTTYGKDHPEYYARSSDGRMYAEEFLQNWSQGKAPNFLHVCLSNPEVRKISRQRLLEWIAKQPERKFFYLSQMDANEFCCCDGCRKMVYEKDNYTDLQLDYANYLAACAAELYPDKVFVVLGYQRFTGRPPVKTKLAENVRMALAPYTPEVADRTHDIDHPLNKIFFKWYQAWLEKFPAKQLYIYDYPIINTRALNFSHEAIFTKMKRYATNGLQGLYFDGRPLYMRDLFIYVTGKLAWSPDNDTGELTSNFIKSYYGPAATQVLKIYSILKSISSDKSRSQGPDLDISSYYTEAELDQLLALYDKAEKAAVADERILKQLRNDKTFVLFSYLTKINPLREQNIDMQKFKKNLGNFLDLALRPECLNIFKIKNNSWLKDWFWKTAGIKIDTATWKGNKRTTAIRKSPLIAQLINSPQSVEISVSHTARDIQFLSSRTGWQIPLAMFRGPQPPALYNWKCKPRNAIILRARQTGFASIARTDITLPQVPVNPKLIIAGQDDDKPGRTPIRITVNKKEIFRGINTFAEKGWSEVNFPLPAELLHKGENELTIEDLSETNYLYSRWLAIAEVRIEGTEKLKAMPTVLFSLDFTNGITALIGKNREPNTIGTPLLTKLPDRGFALNANYTAKSVGQLYFQAAGNYNPSEGSAEITLKTNWDIKTDKKIRTFLHLTSGNKRSGIYLFKYKTQHYLTMIMYNNSHDTGDGVRAHIPEWKADEWHRVGISWSTAGKFLKIYIDEKLLASTENAEIGQEIIDRIYIGSRHIYGDPAGALIKKIKIYRQAIDFSEYK